MILAERMARLGTETAFEVLAKAKALEAEGKDIVHLEIGEPDFDTVEPIVDAAVSALRDGQHHYTPSAGVLPLREAIASEISSSRQIDVNPDEVVVTPGAKPIMFFALLALAEEGSEVIYPDPGFPIYESMIQYVGAQPVPVQLRESLDFRMDVQELIQAANDRTRLIILNSPNNPTGSVLLKEDLEQLVKRFAGSGVMFLSDEVYNRILYEGEAHSIASFPGMKDQTIILDGFSKTYAMTGWRLGYGVMKRQLAEQITKLMVNSNSCTAAFTQFAGIQALKGDQSPVTSMVETFRQRRNRVVELLNQIEGVSCRLPGGAFYVFPNIRAFNLKSSQLADDLLRQAGVALLPGTSFGEHGEGYLRLSYATSMKQLEAGVSRIAEVLEPLPKQHLEDIA